jgi:2-dehydro-3-deoxygluconokinase
VSAPTSTGDRAPLLCVGETMVLLTPDQGNLEQASHVGVHIGGAESNVASGLAHLGHRVEWWSRLGEDPFGNIITGFLAGRSVDVEAVHRDPGRPTGIYFKDRNDGGGQVHYYRAGSAASAMRPDDTALLGLQARTLCHVSGITAAISAEADALLQALLVHRAPGGPEISFDVNYRAPLWPADKAAPRLLELAAAADIVLVGRDEAEALWGAATPEAIRAILPDPALLVVKDADVGATCFHGENAVFVPALRAKVVDAVGAGDAFAAGFLSGHARGFSLDRALRLGHLMAGLTLQHVSDLPDLPPADAIVSASAMDAGSWAGMRISPAHLTEPELLLPKGLTHGN